MSLAMGIDLGTSSTKTIIITEAGEVVSAATAAYPLSTPQPGWVEQNPEDWWLAVCKTIRETLRGLPASFTSHDIKGISLSGQMNGAVLVDAAGATLRPAILWLDGRSQRECDAANDQAGDLFRDRALYVLHPINALAKVLWLREHEPHHYGRAATVLIPKDWLRFRMTGAMASDVSDGSVTGALDQYTRDWSGEILDRLEVRRDLFPRVVESVAVAGAVTSDVAEDTGLIAGTPVCAGGGDMACLAVGCGAIKPGVIGVGIGTAGRVLSYAEEISDGAFNQLWPMCHAVPGKYFWLGCSYTGGGSLNWLGEQFGDDFEVMTAQAEQAPPGCDRLFFMPWLAGAATPHPDAHARGGWLGLTLSHTKGHMIRALMEGVAYDLRHAFECFQRLGLPIDEIRMGEGGVKIELWRQILVDVFGRDGRMMEMGDASAIGAALIAGVGTGVFESFEAACDLAVQPGETVRHDPERAVLYRQRFAQYSRLYPSLKAWFREVAEEG